VNVARTFAFEDIVAAHHYLESNEQFGKIVVTLLRERLPIKQKGPDTAKQDEMVAVVTGASRGIGPPQTPIAHETEQQL
jgi:hypothetical protein